MDNICTDDHVKSGEVKLKNMCSLVEGRRKIEGYLLIHYVGVQQNWHHFTSFFHSTWTLPRHVNGISFKWNQSVCKKKKTQKERKEKNKKTSISKLSAIIGRFIFGSKAVSDQNAQ